MGSKVLSVKIQKVSRFLLRFVVLSFVGSARIVSTIWNCSFAGRLQSWLKWSATGVACMPGFPNCSIERTCSYMRCRSSRLVSPTYWSLHFWQVIVYTTFVVQQEIRHPILTLWFVCIKLDVSVHFLFSNLQYLQVMTGQVVFFSWYTCLGGWIINLCLDQVVFQIFLASVGYHGFFFE